MRRALVTAAALVAVVNGLACSSSTAPGTAADASTGDSRMRGVTPPHGDAGDSPANGDGGVVQPEVGASDRTAAPETGAGRDSSADTGNGANKPNCKYTANATGLSAFQQSGGLAFHVYAPSSYDPAVAHTVVIIMAGQDSDGTAEMADLWQPIADGGEPLVLVAPKGSLPSTDPTDYPSGANWSVNDLNNIQDLMGEIDDCYDVNVKKHILWGFSEGGFYGYLLGIGATNFFSGLAMGGSNTSFAQENGYAPANEQWPVPVSHVQGTTDPNGLQGSEADKAAFEAAGSVFTLYEPNQGHTITPPQVLQQYNDLKNSTSP